jgi:Ni/Fe-hydrogenase subunit HybB-like protein
MYLPAVVEALVVVGVLAVLAVVAEVMAVVMSLGCQPSMSCI